MNSRPLSGQKDKGYEKEKQKKEGIMQTIERIPDGTACKVHHTGNRTSLPLRNRKEKKDCGAQRCRNHFLSTVFSSIIPGFLIKDYDGEPFNVLTDENYEFLLGSYRKYAELMGVKAQHIPGRNIGESIDRLVYDMETLLKDNAGVNLEQKGQQLFFNLWKCHQWGEYTLYYFPVKFVEELNPELKRIAISFINGMANANGIATILDGDETDMVLDWLETEEWDEPETETRNRLATVRSYRKGKIRRLLERVERTSYYKNLPAAMRKYSPKDKWETTLLELMTEGVQFLFPEKPIMHYNYDPYFEEEPDYWPMGLDRQIRITYDIHDIVMESIEEQYNSESQETYDLIPVTTMEISPDTDSLFKMEDDYPERFFRWADKFINHISNKEDGKE